MPWTGASFRAKHNRGLSIAQANKAASVGNAILREGGDDGKAIRIANNTAARTGIQQMVHNSRKNRLTD